MNKLLLTTALLLTVSAPAYANEGDMGLCGKHYAKEYDDGSTSPEIVARGVVAKCSDTINEFIDRRLVEPRFRKLGATWVRQKAEKILTDVTISNILENRSIMRKESAATTPKTMHREYGPPMPDNLK